MNMKWMHFVAGVAGLLVFLFSGTYMKTHFPDAYATNEVIRFQFRANHVYLLLAALINFHAGLASVNVVSGIRALVEFTAKALVILAPLMLAAAFFIEPAHGIAARPMSFYGVVMLLAGTALTLLARIPFRRDA